ncbi:hypothetical protein FYJ27_08655 [Anaerosalibacter bizertensis]|uniref:Tail spike domain-containing protein n=1 Tax=Anaerosalibacter bizertensis TaxID=932217 RepID=A0A844FI88_9FIRM|nr:phage tail spike protein [Anaerosalibacter bizertensis]MSS43797.1 hypothetical protein [Anaerosalibacter bizertensis]
MISLYDEFETNFDHIGIPLKDVISAKVVEEANGMFELELEYPRDKVKELVEGNIIKCNTHRGKQLFRIYRPVKTLKGIKVYARHITYDLLDNFIEDIRPTKTSGANAIQAILNNTQYKHPFIGSSDIENTATAYYIRKNPIQCLIGDEDNSFINRWGGEIVRNNFSIKMKARGGVDRGYEIRLGKNLIGIEEDIDTTEVVTRLYPTTVIDQVVYSLPEKYIDSPLINKYRNPVVKETRMNLPQEYQSNEDEDTEINMEEIYDLMREHCKNLYEVEKIDKPQVNYKVDFIELSKTEQYKDLKLLEQVDLYDIVHVNVLELDINIDAKIIKVEYDVLKDKYEKLELGSFKKKLTDNSNKIKEYVDNKTSDVAKSVNHLKNDIGKQVVELDNSIDNLKSSINELGEDLILTATEAETLKIDLERVTYESTDLVNISKSLGITTEKNNYIAALNTLTNYLNMNWLNATYPLPITQDQANNVATHFKYLEDRKTKLINKIAEVREQNAINYTDNKIIETEDSLNKAIDNATSLITGNQGGYRVDRLNAEGKPYETLYMDTDDIQTATNVIRINQNGIGFSNSGYNGPYETAMTIDGKIVADFITTGTLDANLIKAGTLSSKSGRIYADLDYETFRLGGLSGDIVEHDNTKSKYIHEDGSYTEISNRGLRRRTATGSFDYNYLVYVGEVEIDITGNILGDDVIIQLPDEFKGKMFKAFSSLKTFRLPGGYVLDSITVDAWAKNYNEGTVIVNSSMWSRRVKTKTGYIKAADGSQVWGSFLDSDLNSFTNKGTVEVQYMVIA